MTKRPSLTFAALALAATAVAALPAPAAAARTGTAPATPKLSPVAAKAAPAAARPKRVNCAKVKCLALTFDDGPGTVTARLLDTLRKHKVKATFFLVGERVEKRPGVVRRMAREGHEIGNHTYGHESLPALSDAQIAEQLGRTQDVLHRVIGKRPRTMRPPYGHTDARVVAAAKELGLAQVLWTGTTLDWSLRDVDKIGDKVLSLARPNGVILMHDVVPHTVKAMPRVLRELKRRGYRLVTVSELAGSRRLGPGATFPR
jgi:Predicted xylanase/chitin deacetylase